MRLYKAALVQAFGKGGSRPARAAGWRLVLLATAAAALGLLFTFMIKGLPLAAPERSNLLFFSCFFVMQLAVTITLLSGSFAIANPDDTFARWLRTLPLGTMQRNCLVLLPQLILTGLTLLLSALPLGYLMLRLDLSLLLTLAAAGLGAVSAFGLVYGLPLRAGWRLVCIGLAVATEYKLASLVNPYGSPHTGAMVLYGVLIASLVVLAVYGVMCANRRAPAPIRGTTVRTQWLPASWWFVKKMLRRRTVALSLVVNLVLLCGLVVFSRRRGVADPAMFGLVGAMLVGSFTADIRALARRHRPAEITALYGTLRFVWTQVVVACLFAAITVLPLVWGLQFSLSPGFAAHLLLGMSAGLLAGTLIVPEARDIMSQFLAVICILVLLAALPQLPLIARMSDVQQAMAQAMVALLFVTIAGAVEYTRNNYKWRDI